MAFTSPNQRRITINKELVGRNTGDNRPYLTIYNDTMTSAARDLKGSGFIVYMYLMMNQQGFSFGFSPADIEAVMGISAESARNGFKELVEKKYLILENGTKTAYIFSSRPAIQLPSSVGKKLEKKRFTGDDGKTYDLTYSELVELIGEDMHQEEIIELWKENKNEV